MNVKDFEEDFLHEILKSDISADVFWILIVQGDQKFH